MSSNFASGTRGHAQRGHPLLLERLQLHGSVAELQTKTGMTVGIRTIRVWLEVELSGFLVARVGEPLVLLQIRHPDVAHRLDL